MVGFRIHSHILVIAIILQEQKWKMKVQIYGHNTVNSYTKQMLSDNAQFYSEKFMPLFHCTNTLRLTCSTKPQGLVWSEVVKFVGVFGADPPLLVV